MTDFDEFYRATSSRVLRYALALTGEHGEAQDVTQEAYIRAWRNWTRVSGLEHAESWVRLVVTRLATDRWRRLRVRRGVEAVAPNGYAGYGPSDPACANPITYRNVSVVLRDGERLPVNRLGFDVLCGGQISIGYWWRG